MKTIIIEDVQVGISKGGFACGPVWGHVVVETRLRDGEGKVSYYGLVVLEGIYSFYASDVSRYEKEINEDFEEGEVSPESEGYEGYPDLYEAAKEMEDEAHGLLIRYMACLAELDWKETNALKEATIGKAIGSFEIPQCEAETEYLEELAEEDEDEEEDGEEE